jgi:thiamine biosynthesis lipoprotein
MEPNTPDFARPASAVAASIPLKMQAMGTIFTLHMEDVDPQRAQSCFQAVREEVERVEQVFSRFRASSELSRINRLAGREPVVTDPEVFQMLAAASEIGRRTEGSFDATIGPLGRAWGFATRTPHLPDEETLQTAGAAVGWQYLQLDPADRSVFFLRPGMELDLGAMAKGYVVDRALEVLEACEVEGLVDAGSSSLASTSGASAALRTVAIGHPLEANRTLGEIHLDGRALATSGVREQSFQVAGRRYSHLLDPAGRADPHSIVQTSVLAPSATVADALSTAMFLLGPERGGLAAARFDACAVLWLVESSGGLACQAYNWPTPLDLAQEELNR